MKKKILVLGSTGYIASSFIKNYKKKYKILASIRSKKKSENKIFNHTNKIVENILSNNFAKYKENFIDTAIYSLALNAKESEKNYQLSKKLNYSVIKVFCKTIKKYNIKKLIKLSTIKVYGNKPNFLIDEKTSTNPKDNYSKHILDADKYLEKFCKKNKIRYFILRVSNGYGRPDIKSKEAERVLVNNFVISAINKNYIKIKTQFNINKNFIRIEEIINCIEYLISKKNIKSGIYLLSSKKNISILEMAILIKKIFLKNFNKKLKIFYNFKNESILNKNFKINSSKIEKIGFKTKEKYSKEISKLIKYYS